MFNPDKNRNNYTNIKKYPHDSPFTCTPLLEKTEHEQLYVRTRKYNVHRWPFGVRILVISLLCRLTTQHMLKKYPCPPMLPYILYERERARGGRGGEGVTVGRERKREGKGGNMVSLHRIRHEA